ncbi:hypothetical protein Q8791_18150 [Nocardiopsis sp. CT-R113]|uniref:Uncharacterized protein n=1 Tax=Nocardiopsis codii TaxID=3065942 RepID=A0ABU7KA88_9ACTN|nr:hypothetical protein [Nocardiopsis sp. CT-R113]MEE2039140.1 hypothetical protein [Nocardiopsis sp. CT-R113]
MTEGSGGASAGRRRRLVLPAAAGAAAVLAAAVCLFLLTGRDDGSGPEGPEEPSPGAGASTPPDAEWVRQQVRILVLERMLTEEDPAEIVGSATEDARSALLEGGAVVDDGHGYRVETDPAAWTVADHLGEEGVRRGSVDDAMDALLWENEVTWCGGEVVGRDFVHTYMDTYQEAFDTREEYRESIAGYVDCGTGAID